MISFVLITEYPGGTGSRETVYHEPLPALKARLTRSFATDSRVIRYTIYDSSGKWERRRGDRGWTFTSLPASSPGGVQ